jgi:sugar phosphate isomerase/epimerase
MGSDPIRCTRVLDGAIDYVHAKDTRLEADIVALTSPLENKSIDRVGEQPWNYVTLEGHPGGVQFWAEFVAAVRAEGYGGTLSR